MAEDSLADPVSYEELAHIEDEFEEVDVEIMRQQYSLSQSIYAKRTEAITRIPNFWGLAFEQSPPEIDQYIQPRDSRIFAESLMGLDIKRPQLEASRNGNPRSFSMRFEFKPNDDFEDTVLEKTFWHRRAADGWSGLVSEPVRINWKAGKDLTEGLTDAAAALFEARTKMGDMQAKGLPEYTALKKKVEHWNGLNTSFFTWFGWISGRRWVSAEESEKATEVFNETKAKRKAGETVAMPEEDPELEDDEDVEVHEAGEDLAVAIAEDVWPNAIKYFTQAQEIEEMSDADFEEDDDEMDAEEGDGQPIDIRALVQDKGGKTRSKENGGPPSKRRKT